MIYLEFFINYLATRKMFIRKIRLKIDLSFLVFLFKNKNPDQIKDIFDKNNRIYIFY